MPDFFTSRTAHPGLFQFMWDSALLSLLHPLCAAPFYLVTRPSTPRESFIIQISELSVADW
jgi:hypothetical protein